MWIGRIVSVLHFRNTPAPHFHNQVTQQPNLTLQWFELIKRLARGRGQNNTSLPISQGPGEARGSHLSSEPVRNKHFTHTPLTSRKGNSPWAGTSALLALDWIHETFGPKHGKIHPSYWLRAGETSRVMTLLK